MSSKEIKLDPKNYRVHNDRNKRIIRKSLEDCGAGRSVLIDKDNILIAGNGVYEQAKELGIPIRIIETDGKELVVVKRNDLKSDDEKRKLLALADNHASDTSMFDFYLVAQEFNESVLSDYEFEFPEPIFEKNVDENEDDIPETKESIINNGDLIEMNNHRLLCGDSCKKSDIDLLMNGKFTDLIFTDPPFDLEDNYSTTIIEKAKTNSHVFIMNSDKLLIQNINNNEKYFRKMFYVDFRQARLVSNNQPMTRVDPIAEFCKGKTMFNNLKDGFSTLIECSKIHNKNESQNFGFNQAKKVELPETFILHYSKPNQLVADFFGGAGSTLIACEKNNRICYVNEYNPKNCDIILRRWILYMIENNKLFEIKINGSKISEKTLKNISN